MNAVLERELSPLARSPRSFAVPRVMKILIAEDNQMHRKLLQAQLEAAGQDFLQKPCAPHKILEAVRRCLDG